MSTAVTPASDAGLDVTLDTGGRSHDQGQDLVLDGAGNVLAAGLLSDSSGGFGQFAVVKLAGGTGGAYLLAGDRLKVSDPSPSRRKLTLVSKAHRSRRCP